MQISAAKARTRWIVVVDIEILFANLFSLKNPIIGVFSGQVIGQNNQDAANHRFK